MPRPCGTEVNRSGKSGCEAGRELAGIRGVDVAIAVKVGGVLRCRSQGGIREDVRLPATCNLPTTLPTIPRGRGSLRRCGPGFPETSPSPSRPDPGSWVLCAGPGCGATRPPPRPAESPPRSGRRARKPAGRSGHRWRRSAAEVHPVRDPAWPPPTARAA